MSYEKYLKYKNKYLKLKATLNINQIGGAEVGNKVVNMKNEPIGTIVSMFGRHFILNNNLKIPRSEENITWRVNKLQKEHILQEGEKLKLSDIKIGDLVFKYTNPDEKWGTIIKEEDDRYILNTGRYVKKNKFKIVWGSLPSIIEKEIIAIENVVKNAITNVGESVVLNTIIPLIDYYYLAQSKLIDCRRKPKYYTHYKSKGPFILEEIKTLGCELKDDYVDLEDCKPNGVWLAYEDDWLSFLTIKRTPKWYYKIEFNDFNMIKLDSIDSIILFYNKYGTKIVDYKGYNYNVVDLGHKAKRTKSLI